MGPWLSPFATAAETTSQPACALLASSVHHTSQQTTWIQSKVRRSIAQCHPVGMLNMLIGILLVLLIPSIQAVPAAQLLHCPFACNCTGASSHSTRLRVDCSAQSLNQVPIELFLPSAMNGESLRNRTAGHDIRGYIQHLDLSYNTLQTFHGVTTNTNDNATDRTQSAVAVMELDLSHNFLANVSLLDLSVFKGISSLDLSSNGITYLGVMNHVDNLISLNLSQNSIDDIALDAFKNLNQLESLDLSNNKLNSSQLSQILGGLVKLKHLYLSNNNLTVLEFPHLPNLITLDVADNQINKVPPGTFSAMKSLTMLNMKNNLISDLPQGGFSYLSKLEELHFDQNPTISLDSLFVNLTSLQRLSVSQMSSLTNITHHSFKGLNNLVELNLSHNPQLSFLSPGALQSCPKLQELDLSHCDLQLLSPITFHPVNKSLREVRLLGNPFNCSCSNAWLAQPLSPVYKDAPSLQCQSDSGKLMHFSEANISCEEISLHNLTSVLSTKLGSPLLLQCHYQSESPSVLTWITPRGRHFHQHHFHPAASQHLLTEDDIKPGTEYQRGHYWHNSSSYHSEIESHPDRIVLLADGSLYIDYVLRSDAGTYECRMENAQYNHSAKVTIYLQSNINDKVKIYAFIVGIFSALTFFTLNVIYVIISWIARRLVNKRRREIIRQMLESLNAYKSAQMTRIHENYTHQLSRVRNQYHVQRDKLHKNYTHQVTRMKRGCSNQVEKVRDNYHNRLTQLREYSSNQIVQIRERANNQIVRIRDYGSLQLDRLRETYKLQQQHVFKLLDTMNLDNCRHVVETECMRTESMMFDIDLLGDLDDRTESPMSVVDSEYKTASSSPANSVSEDQTVLRRSQEEEEEMQNELNHCAEDVLIEMKTNLELENGVTVEASRMWVYDEDCDNSKDHSSYLLNINTLGEDADILEHKLDEDREISQEAEFSLLSKDPAAVPEVAIKSMEPTPSLSHKSSSLTELASDHDFVTPATSPVRRAPRSQFKEASSSHSKEDLQPQMVSEEDFHESPETCL